MHSWSLLFWISIYVSSAVHPVFVSVCVGIFLPLVSCLCVSHNGQMFRPCPVLHNLCFVYLFVSLCFVCFSVFPLSLHCLHVGVFGIMVDCAHHYLQWPLSTSSSPPPHEYIITPEALQKERQKAQRGQQKKSYFRFLQIWLHLPQEITWAGDWKFWKGHFLVPPK